MNFSRSFYLLLILLLVTGVGVAGVALILQWGFSGEEPMGASSLRSRERALPEVSPSPRNPSFPSVPNTRREPPQVPPPRNPSSSGVSQGPPRFPPPPLPSSSVRWELYEMDHATLEVMANNLQSALLRIAESIEGFYASRERPGGAPEVVSVFVEERVEKGAFWDLVYPGRPYEPASYVGFRFELRRPQGDGILQVGVGVWSSRLHAWLDALASTCTQLALPPQPGLPEGTYSGLPMGVKVWSVSWRKVPGRYLDPVSALVAYDGLVVVEALAYRDPKDSMAATLEFEEIPAEVLVASEQVARLVMSAALSEVMRFSAMPQTEVLINGARCRVRTTPDGIQLILLSDVAMASRGRLTQKHGVFSLQVRSHQLVFPLASYLCIVDGKEVPAKPRALSGVFAGLPLKPAGTDIEGGTRVTLRFPVIQDEQGPWVDWQAIASYVR
jgi:hypothetical protein